MSNQEKALLVIEALVSDDFCQSFDMAPEEATKEDIEILHEKINMIYRMAHSTREDAKCYTAHESWRKELGELYEKFKKAKVF